MAMAAIPAGVMAAAEMAGTAATVLGGAKKAYDVGKKYGPGAVKVARGAAKLASKRGRKEAAGRLKAAGKAFKKAPSKDRAAMAKGAIKKAAAKTGEAISDVGKLGEIAGEVGAKTGSKRAKAAAEKLTIASKVGKIHHDTATDAAKTAHKAWHETIGTHNAPGPAAQPGKQEILSGGVGSRVARPDPGRTAPSSAPNIRSRGGG